MADDNRWNDRGGDWRDDRSWREGRGGGGRGGRERWREMHSDRRHEGPAGYNDSGPIQGGWEFGDREQGGERGQGYDRYGYGRGASPGGAQDYGRDPGVGSGYGETWGSDREYGRGGGYGAGSQGGGQGGQGDWRGADRGSYDSSSQGGGWRGGQQQGGQGRYSSGTRGGSTGYAGGGAGGGYGLSAQGGGYRGGTYGSSSGGQGSSYGGNQQYGYGSHTPYGYRGHNEYDERGRGGQYADDGRHRGGQYADDGRHRGGEERSWLERAGEKVAGFFGAEDTHGGQHRGRGPKGYRRSDDRIREDISDRLTDDPWLDASSIDVEVKESEVILKGEVTSREDKRRAEDLAEAISGVRNVQNHLRVKGRESDYDGFGSSQMMGDADPSASGTTASQTLHNQASGRTGSTTDKDKGSSRGASDTTGMNS